MKKKLYEITELLTQENVPYSYLDARKTSMGVLVSQKMIVGEFLNTESLINVNKKIVEEAKKQGLIVFYQGKGPVDFIEKNFIFVQDYFFRLNILSLRKWLDTWKNCGLYLQENAQYIYDINQLEQAVIGLELMLSVDKVQKWNMADRYLSIIEAHAKRFEGIYEHITEVNDYIDVRVQMSQLNNLLRELNPAIYRK